MSDWAWIDYLLYLFAVVCITAGACGLVVVMSRMNADDRSKPDEW